MEKLAEQPVAIYGEWLWAVHGVIYQQLDSPFVAFEVWLPDIQKSADPHLARAWLQESGFVIPPLLHDGPCDMEILKQLADQQSLFGEEKREGVYVKAGDGETLNLREKHSRPDYAQNARWSDETLQRQPGAKLRR